VGPLFLACNAPDMEPSETEFIPEIKLDLCQIRRRSWNEESCHDPGFRYEEAGSNFPYIAWIVKHTERHFKLRESVNFFLFDYRMFRLNGSDLFLVASRTSAFQNVTTVCRLPLWDLTLR
jgi:hypothetical protein